MVEGKGVGDFHDGSGVKNLSRIHLSMQEMWVRSLSWEDPLREEMATHSSILAWKVPWTKKPGGLQSMESQNVEHMRSHTQTYN